MGKPLESFLFYIDPMPDWFMDKVSNNTIILMKSDYSKYPIKEAYCIVKTPNGDIRINGGDRVIRHANGKVRPFTFQLVKPIKWG